MPGATDSNIFTVSYISDDVPSSFSNASWIGAIIGLLIAAYFLYEVLKYLHRPLLPRVERLRNLVISHMPSSLVQGLSRQRSSRSANASHIREDEGEAVGHAETSSPLKNMLDMGLGRRRKTLSGAPKGLGNWDNSCYQNSVLQALASLNSLRTFFERTDVAFCGLPASSTIAAIQAMVTELNDVSDESAYRWTPAKLKSMSSWQQQDAQEYFSKLVEAIEKDVAAGLLRASKEERALDLASIFSALTVQDRSRTSSATKTQECLKVGRDSDELLENPSPETQLNNPLEGLMAQRVGCTECGHAEGLSLTPFNCMTVPLGRQALYDLEECLNGYTELDYIDGVDCAKCSLIQAKDRLTSLEAKTRTSLASMPDEALEDLTKHVDLIAARLQTVETALEKEDFTESTLLHKCHIKGSQCRTSRKSRQAAIIRAPTCLTVHVQRSMYDEYTGRQLKNHATVRFPRTLDIRKWCVSNGKDESLLGSEAWQMDPAKSMTPASSLNDSDPRFEYELRAVITHHGRHENGHYICYRKSPNISRRTINPGNDESPLRMVEDLGDKRWWRLSDEDVSPVSEEDVLAQAGAFMLFYELSPQPYVTGADPTKKHTGLMQDHGASTSMEGQAKPAEGNPVPIKDPMTEDQTSTAVSGLEHMTKRVQQPSIPDSGRVGDESNTTRPGSEGETTVHESADPSKVKASGHFGPLSMQTALSDGLNNSKEALLYPARMLVTA